MIVVPDDNISFMDWQASLRIYLNTQDSIPFETDENNWRLWGDRLVGDPTFARFGLPATEWFDSWRAWGRVLSKFL